MWRVLLVEGSNYFIEHEESNWIIGPDKFIFAVSWSNDDIVYFADASMISIP